MKKGKVVEFKPRKEEPKESMEDIYREDMIAQYYEVNGLEDSYEIKSTQYLTETVLGMAKKGIETVFTSEEQAMGMASVLLELPELENVSHFEIRICVSRLSIFFKLEPVLKDNTKYVFPDNDIVHTVNFETIKRLAKEMVKQDNQR